MNQLVINIAYIADNQKTVTKFVDELKEANVHFNLINASDLPSGEDLQRYIVVEGHPCFLIVSDNFLKSSVCLRNGLSYLQKLIKNEQVIPIIIDGVSTDAAGNTISLPTEFEKVSNVIKYMNFWQEKYLELRKLKRNIPEAEEEQFVENLKVVRSISSEVGEYLRNLRDTNYYTLEEFSANHFEAFFRNFGDEASHLKFAEAQNDRSKTTIEAPVTRPVVIEERVTEAIVTEQPVDDFLPIEQLIIEKEKLEAPVEKDLIDNLSSIDSASETGNFKMSIKGLTPKNIDIEAIMATDPEWAIADDEEVESLMEEEEEETETTGGLTDTELLALELAGKLPTNETDETHFEEEEEMISLDDLMGGDFSAFTEKPIPEQTNDYADQPDFAVENLAEQDGVAQPSMDLLSELEESETIVNGEAAPFMNELDDYEERLEEEGFTDEDDEALAEDFMEDEEEDFMEEDDDDELEGYFVDEGEEMDEIEEELSELDVLEAANTLVQSGKEEAGIAFLKEVLAEAPEFVSVRYQYAAFLAQYQNNFKEASNQLAILLEEEPNNLSAKFFLGELAEAERDYLTAKNYYEKVYEENPDFPNAAYKLGMLLVGHLKEDPAEAANYFEKAYAQNLNNINALYQLGLLQGEELSQEAEAIKSLEEVLEKAPEHPFANYDLAIIYHNEGDRTTALQYYEQAAIVNPELKTLVNDQAFAIAKEEMEAARQELEEEALEVAGAQVSALAVNEVAESSMIAEQAENLATVGVVAPQNVVSKAPDSFEFPFSERENTRIIATPTEDVVEKNVLPIKKQAKIALITGATSGIGKATATKLAAEGYQLILAGRRFSRLFQLKDQFEKEYDANVRLLPFDIKDANAVQSALAELEEEWQSIDILINNAGLAKGETAIHEGELGDWDSMIDTNIKGLLYVTREIAPYMVKRRKGQIINVCSLAGKEVYSNNAVYCATKHAVDALTKAMRLDLHKYNIRVSQVSPGYVEDTEFSMVKHDISEPSNLNFTSINAQDVAEVIFFMATQPAHVNLQEIVMTGTQQATASIISNN